LLKLPAGAKLDHAVLHRVGNSVELAVAGLRSSRRLKGILGKIPNGFRPNHHQSLVTSDNDFRHLRLSVDAPTANVTVAQPAAADGLDKVSTTLVWFTNDAWPTNLPGRPWKR